MDYLLLLRGINVGGNHRVPMAELKDQLRVIGFDNVVSYINSGNLIFTSQYDDMTTRNLIRDVLIDNYDFSIEFQIINRPNFKRLIDQAPQWWQDTDPFWRYNALFKLDQYQPDFDRLIESKATDEYDEIKICPNVIYWRSPAKANFSRALYAKMVKEPFYKHVSIRNRNTVDKLAAMMKNKGQDDTIK